MNDVKMCKNIISISQKEKFHLNYDDLMVFLDIVTKDNIDHAIKLFFPEPRIRMNHLISYYNMMLSYAEKKPRRALLLNEAFQRKIIGSNFNHIKRLLLYVLLMRIYSKLGDKAMVNSCVKSFLLVYNRYAKLEKESLLYIKDLFNTIQLIIKLEDNVEIEEDEYLLMNKLNSLRLKFGNKSQGVIERCSQILLESFAQKGKVDIVKECIKAINNDLCIIRPEQAIQYLIKASKVSKAKPNDILQLIDELSQLTPPKDALNYLIESYLIHEGVDVAYQEREKLINKGFLPTAESFNIFLEYWLNNDSNKFKNELYLAKRYQSLNIYTYMLQMKNLLLEIKSNLSLKQQRKMVLETLKEMKELKIQWTIDGLQIYLTVFKELGMFNTAYQIVKDIFDDGILDFDIKTANLVLDVLISNPSLHHINYINSLFRLMHISACSIYTQLRPIDKKFEIPIHPIPVVERKIFEIVDELMAPKGRDFVHPLDNYYPKLVPNMETFEIMSRIRYDKEFIHLIRSKPYSMIPTPQVFENMILFACLNQFEKNAFQLYEEMKRLHPNHENEKINAILHTMKNNLKSQEFN